MEKGEGPQKGKKCEEEVCLLTSAFRLPLNCLMPAMQATSFGKKGKKR